MRAYAAPVERVRVGFGSGSGPGRVRRGPTARVCGVRGGEGEGALCDKGVFDPLVSTTARFDADGLKSEALRALLKPSP